ncbi:hypothetical protein NFI96_002222 [Prochilodus magdalenae]|nr:hypothetical protein NFI96_002222 [Prochilodus magdalenae]
MARNQLVSADGYFSKFTAIGNDSMTTFLKRAASSLTYSSLCLPDNIKERGMEDIPNYYYRDDGLKMWEIIHKFVSGLVSHYYSDQDVQRDEELHAWLTEIREKGGLENRQAGFPESFCTVGELAKFVTMVIFTVSAQHAAVNNGQYPLGHYPEELFSEETPQKLMTQLKNSLLDLEKSIDARNKTLDLPYTYLNPRNGNPISFSRMSQDQVIQSGLMKMAEASISVDQDRFTCPVCLDLLKDPVTIPCGHSFCKVCINGCWDQEDQRGVYSCPQCRETFTPRPALRRNNMLAEVVEEVKEKFRAAPPAPCYAGPGDVECDFCTGRKLKAVKSCLVCVASLCEAHLQPHLEIPALIKHKLVPASSALQEKICSQHDKPIEIYCRTDQSCICYLCTMEEHKGHDTVSAATERTQKQSEVKDMQRKSQQRLQEKEKELQEVKQAVKTLKSSAQAAVEDSERIFTQLIRSIEKKRSEVTELIRAQEKTELSRAEELLEKLEQEIADLKRRDTELEQLEHTEDHIQFLQSVQSLCVSPGSARSPIHINQHPSFNGVRKSLSDLKERLEEFSKQEFSKIPPHDYCRLTLDPNTVNQHLTLSEENRVATSSSNFQSYSDHPERFDYSSQVLSKKRVSGRCYWEVEWKGGRWGLYISVSHKGISRKGRGDECKFGHNSQSWSLRCSPSLSFYHNNIQTEISAPPSSRIGVYVDHSAGTLSFYSVSDTMTLLHTVHTTFTQPLYAGFWLCWGSTVRLCDLCVPVGTVGVTANKSSDLNRSRTRVTVVLVSTTGDALGEEREDLNLNWKLKLDHCYIFQQDNLKIKVPTQPADHMVILAP